MSLTADLPLGEVLTVSTPVPIIPPPPPPKPKCPEQKCVVCEKYLGAHETERDPSEFGLVLDRSFSHVVNADELGKIPNAQWTNLRSCYKATGAMDLVKIASGKPMSYEMDQEDERIDLTDLEGLCGAEEGCGAAAAEEAAPADFAEFEVAADSGDYETL